jgi:hypothetical protein
LFVFDTTIIHLYIFFVYYIYIVTQFYCNFR